MMTKNARIQPGSPSLVSGKPSDRLSQGQALRAGEKPTKEADTSEVLLQSLAAGAAVKK